MLFKKITAYTVAIGAGIVTFGFSANGALLMSQDPLLQGFLVFVSGVSVMWEIQGFTHAYDKFKARQWFWLSVSTVASFMALAYTGTMSFHFLETKWGDSKAERQQVVVITNDIQRKVTFLNRQINITQKRFEEKLAEMSWIPEDTRPEGAVVADIEKMKLAKRWKSTEGCTLGEITAELSYEFCQKYGALKVERANAIGRERIQRETSEFSEKLDNYRQELANIYNERRQTQVVGEADAGASFIVRLLGGSINEKQARDGQIILTVLTFLTLTSVPIPIVRRSEMKANRDPPPLPAEALEALEENVKDLVKNVPTDFTKNEPKKLVKSNGTNYTEDIAPDDKTDTDNVRRWKKMLREWLYNCTVVDPSHRTSRSEAYQHFAHYCEAREWDNDMSESKFAQILSWKLDMKLERRSETKDGEPRVHKEYVGMRLRYPHLEDAQRITKAS